MSRGSSVPRHSRPADEGTLACPGGVASIVAARVRGKMQPGVQRGWWLRFCLMVSTCLHCATERRPDVGGGARANTAPVTSSAVNEPQDIGDFEPEDEDRSGAAVYDPYRDRLYELLFGGDNRRICQLVTVPSFEAESAVYILSPERGTPVVVSRRLQEQLWGSMALPASPASAKQTRRI